mmetsp:Transcript_66289/g.138453  ORF Transcript_66289/g.138453 Transcript_66289/m.138453 type:complete len:82 (-) Transcript_66289:122-367(-)
MRQSDETGIIPMVMCEPKPPGPVVGGIYLSSKLMRQYPTQCCVGIIHFWSCCCPCSHAESAPNGLQCMDKSKKTKTPQEWR